jgi:hypothetical protein
MSATTYKTQIAQAISNYTNFQTELKRLKETPQTPKSDGVSEAIREQRNAAFIALGTVPMKSYWPKTSEELAVMEADARKAVRVTRALLEAADLTVWNDEAEHREHEPGVKKEDRVEVWHTLKDKDDKRAWMVTLLRIAVEWGFNEEAVVKLCMPPKVGGDQKGNLDRAVRERYEILVGMNML